MNQKSKKLFFNSCHENKILVDFFLTVPINRGGHLGGGGGGWEVVTQYRNTVRKIGKYRNTVSKIDEIPIPHL